MRRRFTLQMYEPVEIVIGSIRLQLDLDRIQRIFRDAGTTLEAAAKAAAAMSNRMKKL